MMEHVAKERSADDRFVAELTDLVNEVYAAGEKGIWIEGTDRTSPAEIAAMIEAGHLVVARDGDAVVGAMRLQRLPSGEGEFGMLVKNRFMVQAEGKVASIDELKGAVAAIGVGKLESMAN